MAFDMGDKGRGVSYTLDEEIDALINRIESVQRAYTRNTPPNTRIVRVEMLADAVRILHRVQQELAKEQING